MAELEESVFEFEVEVGVEEGGGGSKGEEDVVCVALGWVG